MTTPDEDLVREVKELDTGHQNCGCPSNQRSVPELPTIDNDEAWKWVEYARYLEPFRDPAPLLADALERSNARWEELRARLEWLRTRNARQHTEHDEEDGRDYARYMVEILGEMDTIEAQVPRRKG